MNPAGPRPSARWPRHFIVNDGKGTYLTRMSLMRLLRLLTIFAVLFSPLSMASGHAAMAMPAASTSSADHMAAPASAGHCADMAGQDESSQPAQSIDCLIACSALPTLDLEVETHPMLASLIEPAPVTPALHGLHPESDPPPPRLS